MERSIDMDGGIGLEYGWRDEHMYGEIKSNGGMERSDGGMERSFSNWKMKMK